MKKILLNTIFLCLFSIALQAQKTQVFLVRHGEKDMTDSNPRDPNLSEQGLLRAKKLADVLKNEKISAVYATPLKRTIQTGTPTAEKNGIEVLTYDPGDNEYFVNEIMTKYKGKKVVIVGHSNTILELLEGFGGKRPIEEVKEEDFGNIFHLIITDKGTKVIHTHF